MQMPGQYRMQINNLHGWTRPIAYVIGRVLSEELLNQHLFLWLADVREATHWWMIEYNNDRPHDALGDLTPMEAHQQAAENSSFELSH
jgi:transposase InsO family protein